MLEKTEKHFRKSTPIITGEASKIEKKTLPAVEVRNTVIFVNPEIEAPFKLEEGESAKLGLFLTPQVGTEDKKIGLEIAEGHGRSAILGRAVFKDKQGRIYRDIDLKGSGFSQKNRVMSVAKRHEQQEASGLLRLSSAYHDKDMAEAFLQAGIRTHRVIAIISLKEIIDENGEKISLGDARGRGIISESIQPVISVRAYGTKYRLHEFIGGFFFLNREERGQLIRSNQPILNDAIAMVAQELGKDPSKFTVDKYLRWLAKTVGQQVGKMHKNGWYHNYLTEHNITLDGRITDLDSVGWLASLANLKGEPEFFKKRDTNEAEYSLREFIKAVNSHFGLKVKVNLIIDLFDFAYNKEVGSN